MSTPRRENNAPLLVPVQEEKTRKNKKKKEAYETRSMKEAE